MRYVKETTHAEFMVSDHIGRNVNEPSQASLHKFAAINLPKVAKSVIYREATVKSTGIAARSKMGWHVW